MQITVGHLKCGDLRIWYQEFHKLSVSSIKDQFNHFDLSADCIGKFVGMFLFEEVEFIIIRKSLVYVQICIHFNTLN